MAWRSSDFTALIKISGWACWLPLRMFWKTRLELAKIKLWASISQTSKSAIFSLNSCHSKWSFSDIIELFRQHQNVCCFWSTVCGRFKRNFICWPVWKITILRLLQLLPQELRAWEISWSGRSTNRSPSQTIIILIIDIIIIINILFTRWEEMSISGEKDTMDFQPLTQFLKCYAIYFASWLSFDYLGRSAKQRFNLFSVFETFPSLTVSCTHTCPPSIHPECYTSWIKFLYFCFFFFCICHFGSWLSVYGWIIDFAMNFGKDDLS